MESSFVMVAQQPAQAKHLARKREENEDGAIPASVIDNGESGVRINSAQQRSLTKAKESAAQRIHGAQDPPAIQMGECRGSKSRRVRDQCPLNPKREDDFTHGELPDCARRCRWRENAFRAGECRGHLPTLAWAVVFLTIGWMRAFWG